MDLVFKLLKIVPTDTSGTVGDSNFREHYAGINKSSAWDTITPSIRKATEKYIIPEIGESIYNDIASKYQAGAELTAEQSKFLTKLQDAVAYFTIFDMGPEINMLLSDLGANERGSSDGTVRPTAQWRYKDFRINVCRRADELLDDLINMLDQFVIDGVSYFDLWKNDPLYLESKTSFFNSAKLFSKYRNINCSRKVFKLLHQDIILVEDEVRGYLGDTQFDTLASNVNSENPEDMSPALKELLTHVRAFIAPKSLATGIPGMAVHIDNRGIKFSNYSDGIESFDGSESSFRGAESLGAFALKCLTESDRMRDRLIEFIYDNIDDYPSIAASDEYKAATSDVGQVICPGDGAIWL